MIISYKYIYYINSHYQCFALYEHCAHLNRCYILTFLAAMSSDSTSGYNHKFAKAIDGWCNQTVEEDDKMNEVKCVVPQPPRGYQMARRKPVKQYQIKIKNLSLVQGIS